MTELATHPAPAVSIRVVECEPWQGKLLGTTFYECGDPAFRFCFGHLFQPARLQRYFQSFLLGLQATGGTIFATVDHTGRPNRQAVLAWRRGTDPFPDEHRQDMLDTLDDAGRMRHQWLRDRSDEPLSIFRAASGQALRPHMTVRPNVMAVERHSQNRKVGGTLVRATLERFDGLGFSTPYLVTSTDRIARFYEREMGFNRTRELYIEEYSQGPIPEGSEGLLAVIMHRAPGSLSVVQPEITND